jgi:hypothetical protein
MGDEEERIREFAYRIWEQEGHPVGQEDRHWEMAKQIAREEENERAGIAVGLDGPEKSSEAKTKPAS